MPLVFLPDRRELFHWGENPAPPGLMAAVDLGTRANAALVTPTGKSRIAGTALPLLDSIVSLAATPFADVRALSGSVAIWTLASKLALDLVSRERVVPTVVREGEKVCARWAAALAAPDDAAQVRTLAGCMPPASHAIPVTGGATREVWAPEALLRAFIDAGVDALLRNVPGKQQQRAPRPRAARRASSAGGFTPWEQRWQAALSERDDEFVTQGFTERTLPDDLLAWSEPAKGARDRLRACFRLDLPPADRQSFDLRFLLQSPDDPSLLVTAEEVWNTKGRNLAKLGRAFRDPQEALLEALGRAARLYAPIADVLAQARPEAIALAPPAAWQFLREEARVLAEAGFGVIVPGELTPAGQRRLRLRMRVNGTSRTAGAVSGTTGLAMDQLIDFEWQAALGDETITKAELATMARHKAPLVRHRGQWIAVDPDEIAEINRLLTAKTGKIDGRTAIVAALAGETHHGGLNVAVTAAGTFGQLLAKLRAGADRADDAPPGLRGTLRPYQARGLAWLRTLASLGLGACLADDMGLGKTIQILAFLLHRSRQAADDERPVLLVAPTSVLGNWEREAARFAPDLRIVHHYGAERARKPEDVPRAPAIVVLTSYGLLRRDAALLSAVSWSAVVLDEAQNIKNAASATAKAARAVSAVHRFALTGTPVENRLAELWSIFEFANPGLLGPLESFRRRFAVPIERYGNDEVAQHLRRIAGPFLLRRLKADPAIVRDLPPKNEMSVVCTLTREQATLYQAVVDEEMRRIEAADGIERRGRVLALLMSLKQICNHPAHYLGEAGPLRRRSGKLERITEMLEEALAAGDKALVFTQFREMGDRLLSHFEERLGIDVAFLHGGTSRKARNEMVRRFQEDASGPRVFVLSLKAGGTGLNLTAASHVFHFDRWWNPAVEDQATDRAHRIGQKRIVQVHKLVCAGTVEEKVGRMLEQKRDLASKVIGTGESWITELGNAELRELFALASDATVDGGDDEDRDTIKRVRGGAKRDAPLRARVSA